VQDKLRRMPQVARSVFRYVAVGIHYLLRQHHEVAGSRAGLAWDEESTRLSLKDRDAHHIPDAKRDPSRRQSTENTFRALAAHPRRQDAARK
jgi:hypothetical protein